jgi:periplasmic copper chaperone A
MRKTLGRTGAVLVGLTAGVLLAVPAFAHVTVNPGTATQGGYTKLTFRVPNEKDTGNTVAVEVDLPQDTPIASVALKPVPGWTAVATKSKLATPIKGDDGEITEAVTKIVWTASADSAIKPGQFQEFDVSAGPLPKVDQVVFKALQTYSDGEIVRWIEAPNSTTPPDHPAPTLKLTQAAGSTDSNVASVSTGGATPGSSAGGSSSTASAALGIGIAALVIALAGLVLALLSRRRTGRPSAS